MRHVVCPVTRIPRVRIGVLSHRPRDAGPANREEAIFARVLASRAAARSGLSGIPRRAFIARHCGIDSGLVILTRQEIFAGRHPCLAHAASSRRAPATASPTRTRSASPPSASQSRAMSMSISARVSGTGTGGLGSGEDGISLISLGRDGEWEDYKTKMSWTMHPEKTRLRPTGALGQVPVGSFFWPG